MPIISDETVCVCGGEIFKSTIEDAWYHSRIEDFSHDAKPAS